MRYFLLVLIFLANSLNPLFSQDQLSGYNRAKTLMGYGNYADAMNLLRPYMDAQKFGNLSQYATYHFAKSAYHQGQYLLVESVLKDLANQETWGNKDKAKYLLALAYFQEGRNIDALELITKITEPSVKEQAENASYNFLKNASVGFLMGNIRKYNENKGFMLALKEQIEKQTVLSTDERAIYNQIRTMDFGNKGVESINKNSQVLDVAVVLPFNYSGGKGVQNLAPNNFVFELYQGIQFAAEELNRQGMKVNLKSFDSERNLSKLSSILEDPFLKQADIIIGPIYPDEVEMVMGFSERNSIPFINPLSNVDEKYEGLNFAYLFRPSISALSEGMIEFARKNIVGRRLAIGYSNTTRDELLAKSIAEKAQRFGYSIVRNDQINGRSIQDFMERIQLKNGDQANADLVIILSDDPNVAAPAFGFMESQNVRKPVLVMDSWLFFNFANYEMLEEQNFHFVSNNTVQFDKSGLERFREDFYSKYINYPSFNAHLGYELMYWVSQNIGPRMGFNLRENLNRNGFQNGKITHGFDFRNSNSNRFVPVLKLENGMLLYK
ncbi:ABC transporter substrate-binding protein [Cecembia calidifontis]|uniref:Amino acid/amide ABC transporter substrate-binding protein (HAAT family) n=1 Tax=Cecembia calidifontis TaxID=1187080 RepID=A0A4Q7P8H0_9BACT|nr:ABC transporter substrate-binding protein [Cecembia calidifontis]RZS96167.1 amino acid/amide ABC transporter substrate-binding protein (HAAT family) [Cecembia calidifontis]